MLQTVSASGLQQQYLRSRPASLQYCYIGGQSLWMSSGGLNGMGKRPAERAGYVQARVPAADAHICPESDLV